MRRGVVLGGVVIVALGLVWVSPWWPASHGPGSRSAGETTTGPVSPQRRDGAPAGVRPVSPEPVGAAIARDPPARASGLAELRALDQRFAAFEALDLDYELPEGATREEEDRLMLGRMKEDAAEAQRLEEAYRDIAERWGDPRVQALAEIAIGDVKDALHADLTDAPTPSYLTPEQAELFAMGMEDKAWAAGAAAREAWDRAADLAEALGPDREIEALLAERRPPPE